MTNRNIHREISDLFDKDEFKKNIKYGADKWIFYNISTEEGREIIFQKEEQFIPLSARFKNKYIVASNESDDRALFLIPDDSEIADSRLFSINKNGTVRFYAYSISQLLNSDKYDNIRFKLNSPGKYETEQALAQFEDCPGTQFALCYLLKVPEDDSDYSEVVEKYIVGKYKEFAAIGHPDAATELAFHYYLSLNDEGSEDTVIAWMLKAVQLGNLQEYKSLAEYIIDECPDRITELTETLNNMITHSIDKGFAYYHLGNLYASADAGVRDIPKAVNYYEMGISAGNYNAVAASASMYEQGIGYSCDKVAALELFKMANQMYIDQKISDLKKINEYRSSMLIVGKWDTDIQRLSKEIKNK